MDMNVSEKVESVTRASATRGQFFINVNDDHELCKNVNGLLSCCLTAYEIVAPQVVDANLSVIIRIAAKAAVQVPTKGYNNNASNTITTTANTLCKIKNNHDK